MSHHSLQSGYDQLVSRLNRFPQGITPNDTMFAIFRALMSEEDAALMALLPVRPFSLEKAAKAWHMTAKEAEKRLDHLADRALVLDLTDGDDKRRFAMPPPIIGFFEFTMMRTRGDIDQKLLSDLYHTYLVEQDDFMRDLLLPGETKMGRAFVSEGAIPEGERLHVLSFEKATEVIETAPACAVSDCYCRHVAAHRGTACNAPREICLSFGSGAKALSRHGHARLIEKAEARDLLAQAISHNLVQFGENAKRGVSFLCNCCPCCCEAMHAAQRFAFDLPVQTTGFVPQLDTALCKACGKCKKLCPVFAIQQTGREVTIDTAICLGCGVCARACPHKAITLKRREQTVLVPETGVHRILQMAIERGKLEHLIFDTDVFASHHRLAALLGGFLRLTPVQRALTSKTFKSKYLAALCRRME